MESNNQEQRLAEVLMERVNIRATTPEGKSLHHFDCPACGTLQEGFFIPLIKVLALDFSVRCRGCKRVFKVLSIEPYRGSEESE